MKLSDEDYNSVFDLAYDELSYSDEMDKDEWLERIHLAIKGKLTDLAEDISNDYEISDKVANKIIKQAAKQLLKEDRESDEDEDSFNYYSEDWD